MEVVMFFEAELISLVVVSTVAPTGQAAVGAAGAACGQG